MENAFHEFQILVKGKAPVRCAAIRHYQSKVILLKVGYTDAEYADFLEQLHFHYDDGFGSQELYGMVWFEDGTWAERREYGGSEWWVYQSMPMIPNELGGKEDDTSLPLKKYLQIY